MIVRVTADLRRRLFGEQEETSETQAQPEEASAGEQGTVPEQGKNTMSFHLLCFRLSVFPIVF